MSVEKALNQYTKYATYMAEIAQSFKNTQIAGMVLVRVYNDGSVINRDLPIRTLN